MEFDVVDGGAAGIYSYIHMLIARIGYPPHPRALTLVATYRVHHQRSIVVKKKNSIKALTVTHQSAPRLPLSASQRRTLMLRIP